MNQTMHLINNQEGAIKIFVGISAIVLLGILALVVDYSSYQSEELNAKILADTLAMSGAGELNGHPEGWMNAKKAVLLTLKQTNKIFGFKGPTDPQGNIDWSSFVLDRGTKDPYVSDQPQYEWNQGKLGNLTLTIERGAYWEDPSTGEPTFKFVNFETITPAMEQRFGAAGYVIANAVKVRTQVGGMDSTFAGLVGTKKLKDVEGTSIAASSSDIEQCTYPIAIPLCQLMRDLNVGGGSSVRARTDWFEGTRQCSREVIAMEANAELSEFRLDGLTRAYSYPRLPMVPMNGMANDCFPVTTSGSGYPRGEYPNCKATPIKATLGVPASSSDEELKAQAATPKEIARLFHSFNPSKPKNSCVKSRLGTIFRPMETAVDQNGEPFVETGSSANNGGFLQNRRSSRLERKLIQLITSGEKSFSEAFIDDNGNVKPNFPLNRWSQDNAKEDLAELMLAWPVEEAPGHAIMLMEPKGNEGQTGINPACHTAGLSNNLGRSVKEVKLMVVVPGVEGIDYCGESSYVTAASTADIIAMHTAPTVVGYVRGFLFDFHIRKHQDTETIPGDNNPLGLMSPVHSDAVQGVLDGLDNFFQEHRRWRECQRAAANCVQCQTGCDANFPPTCEPGCQWEQCPACEDEPVFTGADQIPDFSISEGIQQCFETPAACWNMNPDVILGPDIPDAPDSHPGRQDLRKWRAFRECIRRYYRGGQAYFPSKDDKECLPYKRHSEDPNDPNSWEIRDLRPQYLCGGLRLRLECEDANLVKPVSEGGSVKPLLVTNPDEE